MKHLLSTILLLVGSSAAAQTLPAEQHFSRESLHPRYRQWARPSGDAVVRQNPPSLLWPASDDAKNAEYRVRMSQDSTFAETSTFLSERFEWAAYGVHKPLAEGRWYWQWSVTDADGTEHWSDTNTFVVGAEARTFATPTAEEFAAKVSSLPHFRLYVQRDGTDEFRARTKNNEEAQAHIRKARRQLDMEPVPVAPTRPRDTTGMTDYEKKVMINFMYHKFGEKVTQPAVDFSLAYLLSGEECFARAAVKHALYAAALPADSDATSEDFNRSAIMFGLAMAYDTAADFMTCEQRRQVLEAIRVRGEYFYRHYVKNFECHSMDNHVWQHTMRNFFFAAIATAGDIAEADKWLRYCYEVWCSRFPILGGEDGGWHDGASYFQANMASFIYIPMVLSRLTGCDFFDIPWYRNLPEFLIYSFPKDSYATGYGDDYDKMQNPPAQYIGFADALARELQSPEARWYADRLTGGSEEALRKSRTFTLYRILADNPSDCVEPRAPQPMSARFYPDAGFSIMHTRPDNAGEDLMTTFIGVPFGSTGHAHAAHNGFTISYGGRQLFGGTGYYSNFNDKHTMMHYRTRGHCTVLADGLAQCIGENGYGWLARFADTPSITYTLGDASHAYDLMRTPFWIDRMEKSGVEYTAENGFGDPGVTRFRRHFVVLKPDIIVIYDELEASHPVEWTWLLHSHNRIESAGGNRVTADNGSATGDMQLYADNELRLEITDRFFSPAVNWKGRTGADGKPLVYANHWHAEFTTAGKSRSQRFLAIFRITPEGMQPAESKRLEDGSVTVGEWTIRAETDGSKAPRLEIEDRHGNRVAYNTSASTVEGTTMIYSPDSAPRELADEIPVSLRGLED